MAFSMFLFTLMDRMLGERLKIDYTKLIHWEDLSMLLYDSAPIGVRNWNYCKSCEYVRPLGHLTEDFNHSYFSCG